MERRKFVIGMGALATGSSAAVGTGAFDSMSAERGATINVVDDSNGLIALSDKTDSDVVRASGGELVIDFNPENEGTGVNVDSRYQVGRMINYPPGEAPGLLDTEASPVTYEEPAFSITNQDTVEHDISLNYSLNGSIGSSKIYFQLQTEEDGTAPVAGSGNTNGDISGEILIPNAAGRGNETTVTLGSGEYVGVSFIIEAGDDPADNLSGTLTVSAE